MTEEEARAIYGRNVKRLREKKQLTQEKFSESIGISEKYLSVIETGRKFGSFETFIALSNSLGVEPYELLLPQEGERNSDSGRKKRLMKKFRANLSELADTVEEFLED